MDDSRVRSWWIHALFTCVELARDRGYDTQPYQEFLNQRSAITLELRNERRAGTRALTDQWYQIYIDDQQPASASKMYYFNDSNQSKTLMVVLAPRLVNVNNTTLTNLFSSWNPGNGVKPKDVNIIVVVSPGGTIKHLAVAQSWPHLRAFTVNELVINPTRHSWYDEHQPLDPESDTYRELMTKVGNTEQGLLKSLWGIYYTDVVARYFGFMGGQIIRVVNRENITTNSIVPERIAYRVVHMDEFKR